MGLDVRLLRNLNKAREAELLDRQRRSWRILASRPFRGVLDIGANEGQFAEIARELWPTAIIHSFEPLPEVFGGLVRKFAGDSRFHAHNLALSNCNGSQQIHHSAFSPSSSLLPMAEAHRKEWPESVQHRVTNVRVARLDDWARSMSELPRPLFVKIDVQRFELHVIEGGLKTISIADVVVLEASFQEFYEGQPLFADIHARMQELGYSYRGNVEQFNSKDGASVLYADAIFERARCTGLDV